MQWREASVYTLALVMQCHRQCQGMMCLFEITVWCGCLWPGPTRMLSIFRLKEATSESSKLRNCQCLITNCSGLHEHPTLVQVLYWCMVYCPQVYTVPVNYRYTPLTSADSSVLSVSSAIYLYKSSLQFVNIVEWKEVLNLLTHSCLLVLVRTPSTLACT